MLKALKALTHGRESGALTAKTVSVGERTVKCDRVIGEGGFATIYRCTDVDTGDVFALKHFLLTGYPDAARDVEKEVTVMKQLAGCPHIVHLHAAAVAGPPGAPNAALVLMDFCPDTLVGFLHQCAYRLDDATLLRIALPICHAVEAMHSLTPPLAHRDLKAENVLLGPGGGWVLCDFGSASTRHGVLESARDIALEEEVVRRYTTPAYRAPELYDLYAREYIGPPVDIWALGVLLYLLAYGKLPFEGEAKLQVLNGRYTLPEGRPALHALIKDMLTISPRQRPTIQQVISRLAKILPANSPQPMPAGQQQQQPKSQQHHGSILALRGQPWAAAAPPNGCSAPRHHERAPSQGWADFAANSTTLPPTALASVGSSGSAAASDPGRSGSSGSWATFSPKKEQEVAAASSAAVTVTSAGSFWSSFGEEVPAEAVEPPKQAAPQEAQPPVPPAQGQGQAHSLPAPAAQQQPSRQQPAASIASAVASRSPQAGGAGAQPTPPPEPAESSPLSAGLSRMTLGRSSHAPSCSESAAKPAARAVASSSVESGPARQEAVAGPAGPGCREMDGDVEALRHHCAVLEQLLDSRNEEVHRLQKLVEQQAQEISRLRQLQQAEQASQQGKREQQVNGGVAAPGSATLLPSALSATAAPRGVLGGSTIGSSRLGRDSLVLSGSSTASGSSSPRGSSDWTFNPGADGVGGDAPTPTMHQPFGGKESRGSAEASEAATAASAALAASAASAAAKMEGVLRAKLDLSGDSLGSNSSRGFRGSSGSKAEQQHAPMRSNSSGGLVAADSGSNQGTEAPQLRSFPVNITSGTSTQPDGYKSAPVSANPSPVQTGSVGLSNMVANGKAPSFQLGSPMKGRGSGLSTPQSGSPSKHRRNTTAPNAGFFSDLNPLQPGQ